MSRRLAIPLILALAAVGASGCSSESGDGTPSVAMTTSTAAPDDPQAAMRRAVETALDANRALARRVLWTNEVPSSASRSTRGSALDALRRSAAERAREGVRVRVIGANTRFEDIRIDPSYASATAEVVNRGRVRVERRGQRPRVVPSRERVTVELRRIGDGDPPRFVVWSVQE